jgi:hypothetical protein
MVLLDSLSIIVRVFLNNNCPPHCVVSRVLAPAEHVLACSALFGSNEAEIMSVGITVSPAIKMLQTNKTYGTAGAVVVFDLHIADLVYLARLKVAQICVRTRALNGLAKAGWFWYFSYEDSVLFLIQSSFHVWARTEHCAVLQHLV